MRPKTCPHCYTKFANNRNLDYHVEHRVCLQKVGTLIKRKIENQTNPAVNKDTVKPKIEFAKIGLERIIEFDSNTDETEPTSQAVNCDNDTEPTSLTVDINSDITRKTLRSRGGRGRGGRSQSARPPPSYRSPSRTYRPTVGSLYLYQIIFRYKARSEALTYLQLNGVPLDNIDDSTIICEDDLGCRILVKVGKTGDSCLNRQINYINSLSDLYWIDLDHRLEYEIDFVANLQDMESAAKLSLYTPDPVKLLRPNEKVIRPNEVFVINSLEEGDIKVKNVVKKYQLGRPITQDCESIMKIEEARLKQEELKLKLKQEEVKLKVLEKLGMDLHENQLKILHSLLQ